MDEPDAPVASPLLPGVRTATRLGLGIVAGAGGQLSRALAGDQDDAEPAGRSTDSRLTAAAVGLVFEAQDLAASSAERVGAIASPFVGFGRSALAAPLLSPARRWAEDAIDRLVERGEREQEAAAALTVGLIDNATGSVIASPRLSETASTALDQLLPAILPGLLEAALPQVLDQLKDDPDALVGLVDRLIDPILASALPVALDRLAADPAALGPLVDGVVGGVLESVLDEAIPLAIGGLAEQPELITGLIDGIIDPVLDSALPVAMGKLEEDPTVVRDLVLGQSTGMASDLANQVRSRTVGADDLVERIARKVTFRKPRTMSAPALPAPAPTPSELLHPEGSHALGPPALEAPPDPEHLS